MLTGVLMVALPISVVGSNFTTEYNAVHGEDTDNEQIYTSLLELIDDDVELYETAAENRLNKQMIASRKLSAISTVIACLDTIKHRKLKKELMNIIEASRIKKPDPNDFGNGNGNGTSETPLQRQKLERVKSYAVSTQVATNAAMALHGYNIDDVDAEKERELNELSVLLKKVEHILSDSRSVTPSSTSGGAETIVPSNLGTEMVTSSSSRMSRTGSRRSDRSGQYVDPGVGKPLLPQSMHYLYEESKDITVLNEDREWLDMVAKEKDITHSIQISPLETIKDLAGRMQNLYVSYDGTRSTWYKSAIDRAEVQALALETAELHLADLSKLNQDDQRTFFAWTYNLLCIHASAACKVNIETVVQNYPSRIGYKIGKRIYTLAEIYDLKSGGAPAPQAGPSESKSGAVTGTGGTPYPPAPGI